MRVALCGVGGAPHPLDWLAETAVGEVAGLLGRLGADVLCCSGYKPDLIGWRAARRSGVPVVAIAHGWTGVTLKVLDERVDAAFGRISISTMHLAKGLEFRAVAVMACDDEVVPLQSRIESITDEADLDDVYSTERHLLYVACTRARDHLLVSSVEPASEFLDDFRSERVTRPNGLWAAASERWTRTFAPSAGSSAPS